MFKPRITESQSSSPHCCRASPLQLCLMAFVLCRRTTMKVLVSRQLGQQGDSRAHCEHLLWVASSLPYFLGFSLPTMGLRGSHIVLTILRSLTNFRVCTCSHVMFSLLWIKEGSGHVQINTRKSMCRAAVPHLVPASWFRS